MQIPSSRALICNASIFEDPRHCASPPARNQKSLLPGGPPHAPHLAFLIEAPNGIRRIANVVAEDAPRRRCLTFVASGQLDQIGLLHPAIPYRRVLQPEALDISVLAQPETPSTISCEQPASKEYPPLRLPCAARST